MPTMIWVDEAAGMPMYEVRSIMAARGQYTALVHDGSNVLSEDSHPIQGLFEGPNWVWLEKQIAGPDKGIGGMDIRRRVGDDSSPPKLARHAFAGSNQSHLKAMAAVHGKHARSMKVSRRGR